MLCVLVSGAGYVLHFVLQQLLRIRIATMANRATILSLCVQSTASFVHSFFHSCVRLRNEFVLERTARHAAPWIRWWCRITWQSTIYLGTWYVVGTRQRAKVTFQIWFVSRTRWKWSLFTYNSHCPTYFARWGAQNDFDLTMIVANGAMRWCYGRDTDTRCE